MGIVLSARSGVTIAVEITKTFVSIEVEGKAIAAYLAFMNKAFVELLTVPPGDSRFTREVKKAVSTSLDTALIALGKIVGVPTPNTKDVGSLLRSYYGKIIVLKNKIYEMDTLLQTLLKQSQALSQHIDELDDGDKKTKLEKNLKKVEGAIAALFEKIERKATFARLLNCEENHYKWAQNVKTLEDARSDFAKFLAAASTIAIEAGLEWDTLFAIGPCPDGLDKLFEAISGTAAVIETIDAESENAKTG
jgi:hypothetical protein